MRITKEFNLGHLKCTLFFHNDKHSLKIEDEYGEISYKLGDLGSASTDEIAAYMNLPKITSAVIDSFRFMRTGRDQLLSLIITPAEEAFEEII